MSKLFCFGFGYTARHLADRADGFALAGTARTARSLRDLAGRGIEGLRFDGAAPAPDVGAALAGATHVLVSIPPDAGGDPVLRHHADDVAACAGLAWIGYLSSTAVYGDRGGGWVDEDAPPAPGDETASQRLAAETAWRGFGAARGLPVHVFRVAGIYGPGRSPLDRLRAGAARRVVKPGHVLSRIHAADLAAALRASMDRPRPGAVYNLADDEPAAQEDVIGHAARLLGIPPPPPVSWRSPDLPAAARRFFAGSRRVCNRRVKRELGLVLRYPTYREGLAALAAE